MTALTITRPGRREVAGVGLVAVVLAVVALVAVADFPTGEHRAEGVVRSGARLAARADVADVEVLLTVDAGELVAIVAYEGEKGWLGVDLEPVPTGTAAAWASTRGEGPVPALSAVYGRAPGDSVRVAWGDGRETTARTERDGSYVLARRGRVGVDRVTVFDGGTVALEVKDL